MEKDFDGWNVKKKEVNEKATLNLFNEGDIWSCNMGINVGFEQDGKGTHFLRPILIIKKFNKSVFWGLPMTHSPKENPYFHAIKSDPASKVILSQLKLIDAKR